MPAGEYDVVVVGAGILGCASAYHIQRLNPGHRTLLIDRLPAAGQANTGRSAAMFRNVFNSGDNRTLADTSIDYYVHLAREKDVDIGLEMIGYLWLMDERQLKESAPQVQAMEREGVEFRDYSAGELKKMMPSLTTEFQPGGEHELMGLEPVAGGLFAKKCGALRPEKLVYHYVDEFVRLGGKVAFNTEATELLLEPDRKLGLEHEPFAWQESRITGVAVRGDLHGEIRSKRTVLATGAWANGLLEPRGMDSHTKAKKRQIFRVGTSGSPELGGLLRTEGFSEHKTIPFVILPRSGIYIKPVKSENAFWLGCDEEVNRAYIDVPPELDELQPEASHYENNIRPVLKEYFPAFAGARPSSMWAGLFGINSIDHLPYVFAESGVVVVAGDSGSGIMKGDAIGRIAAGVCEGSDEARLYGGASYSVGRLHYRDRKVEQEKWLL